MFRFSIVLSLIFVALTGASAEKNVVKECLKVRIGLDIGSGSTKIRSGIVNACTQVVLAQVAKTSVPIPFKDHLTREKSDGKFTVEFLDQAVKSILEAV